MLLLFKEVKQDFISTTGMVLVGFLKPSKFFVSKTARKNRQFVEKKRRKTMRTHSKKGHKGEAWQGEGVRVVDLESLGWPIVRPRGVIIQTCKEAFKKNNSKEKNIEKNH